MKKFLVFYCSLLILFAVWISKVDQVAAANSSIVVSPSTGTHNTGDIFTIAIKADGGGKEFNVAQANVNVPSNLQVQNVIFGDCNFAFVTTPDVNNLSFVGAILGGKSTQCTALTAQIKALSPGAGNILLTNAKLKSYPDAQELSLVAVPGQYTINQSNNQQSGSTHIASGQTFTNATTPLIDGEYSVAVNVVTQGGKPIAGATIALSTPQQATANTPQTAQNTTQIATTDDKGIARFSQVPEGTHEVVVKKDNKEVAKEVITVKGHNGTLQFGIQAEKSTNSWLVWLILPVLLILIAGVILYKKKGILNDLLRSKLTEYQTNSNLS